MGEGRDREDDGNSDGDTRGKKLIGVTETCTRETREETEIIETREMEELQKETETNKCIETREIEKIEGILHGKDGVKDEHTHTQR